VGKNIEKIITDTARTIDLSANNAPGWMQWAGDSMIFGDLTCPNFTLAST
jgi:hypothetical protein